MCKIVKDPSEQTVERFLKKHFTEVEHEPNGPKTFPDFIVDKKLIVEVRIINETKVIDAKIHSLENTRISIFSFLSDFFSSYKNLDTKINWLVSARFSRPIKIKKLKNKIHDQLDAIFTAGVSDAFELQIAKNFKLVLRPTFLKNWPTQFEFYKLNDNDFNPLIYSAIFEDINFAIKEKSKLLIENKYSNGWLILTSNRHSSEWGREFIEMERIPIEMTPWSRITILDFTDGKVLLDVQESKGTPLI